MLFDMDHSAATYAVADALAQRYAKLVLLDAAHCRLRAT